MRFVPGMVVGLVFALAFVLYRTFGDTEAAPPRDFLELELAAADDQHTGTCYSLSTVLIANTVGYSNATISWHRVDRDTWTRRNEELLQSYAGPTVQWQSFTFKRENEQIVPIAHDAAPDPVPPLSVAIDRLLEAPITRRSTRIDRCLKGEVGYAPKT